MPYYGLRTCNPDMTSYGGFKWKKRGRVVAPDWEPSPVYGKGLHAFLDGQGNGNLSIRSKDAYWLVVEFNEYVNLIGNVKFPECEVLFASQDRLEAIAFLKSKVPTEGVIGDMVSAGDRGTATVGDCGAATVGDHGTATAGDFGTATASYWGTATAGYWGTAIAGNDGAATADRCGTATAGDFGTATAGDFGTATAGDEGTATAGYYGTAIAGDGGIATAGYFGTATAGKGGTAKAGEYGTATADNHGTVIAGEHGVISIFYYTGRKRIKIGYIGEDGLKPNTPYMLDNNFNFVEVTTEGTE